MSVQQGYTFLGSAKDCNLAQYTVYSKLVKLGYRVRVSYWFLLCEVSKLANAIVDLYILDKY